MERARREVGGAREVHRVRRSGRSGWPHRRTSDVVVRNTTSAGPSFLTAGKRSQPSDPGGSMSVRKLGLVLAAVCAALLVVPVTAGAQTTPTTVTSLKSVPVTGKANNGKSFTGHFNVSQFVARNGKAYALGTLTGKIGNRTVKQSNVAIPVSMGTASGP